MHPRLAGFDRAALLELGAKVRDLYADGTERSEHVRAVVNDAYVATLADAVTGSLGGSIGIAPRVFLKKLVGEVLDRVDQFPDFDPRQHYALTLGDSELTEVERNAARTPARADDIELDV